VTDYKVGFAHLIIIMQAVAAVDLTIQAVLPLVVTVV
jgi:hypothetical protein